LWKILDSSRKNAAIKRAPLAATARPFDSFLFAFTMTMTVNDTLPYSPTQPTTVQQTLKPVLATTESLRPYGHPVTLTDTHQQNFTSTTMFALIIGQSANWIQNFNETFGKGPKV
jgi:hypothetical protein